jgi:hypothetical protein
MALRRKGRPAGRRAALRWWLLSLAGAGAAVTAAAALLAVALHVSASASAGAPYRLAKVRATLGTLQPFSLPPSQIELSGCAN